MYFFNTYISNVSNQIVIFIVQAHLDLDHLFCVNSHPLYLYNFIFDGTEDAHGLAIPAVHVLFSLEPPPDLVDFGRVIDYEWI